MANRGEIAVRVIRAVHELGMRAVAVYSADDSVSRHVERADEAVLLSGSGPAGYLDAAELVRAARASGCGLVHPGYGFLSENAKFARLCAAGGIRFIGPGRETLDLFGDKVRARAFAAELGVPIMSGTSGPTSLSGARAFFVDHDAVMSKAVAGGGGRGMREVRDAADLAEAYERCSAEALAAFGNPAVYVERLLTTRATSRVGDGQPAASMPDDPTGLRLGVARRSWTQPMPGLLACQHRQQRMLRRSN